VRGEQVVGEDFPIRQGHQCLGGGLSLEEGDFRGQALHFPGNRRSRRHTGASRCACTPPGPGRSRLAVQLVPAHMAPAAIGSQKLEQKFHRRPWRSAERGSLPGAGGYTSHFRAGRARSAAGGHRVDDAITLEKTPKSPGSPAGDRWLAHRGVAVGRCAQTAFRQSSLSAPRAGCGVFVGATRDLAVLDHEFGMGQARMGRPAAPVRHSRENQGMDFSWQLHISPVQLYHRERLGFVTQVRAPPERGACVVTIARVFHPFLPVRSGSRYVRARTHKFFVSFITWVSLLGVGLGWPH